MKKLIKFLNDDWEKQTGGNKELQAELIIYMVAAALMGFMFILFSVLI